MPFDLSADGEDPFAVIINGETMRIPDPTSKAARRYLREMRDALQFALDAQKAIDELPAVTTPEEQKEQTNRIDQLTEEGGRRLEEAVAAAVERLTEKVITAPMFLALAMDKQRGLTAYIRDRLNPEVEAPATTPSQG